MEAFSGAGTVCEGTGLCGVVLRTCKIVQIVDYFPLCRHMVSSKDFTKVKQGPSRNLFNSSHLVFIFRASIKGLIICYAYNLILCSSAASSVSEKWKERRSYRRRSIHSLDHKIGCKAIQRAEPGIA